jgi:hypothetical protein
MSSNVARIVPKEARASDYLGPAEVLRVEPGAVHVRTPDGVEARAEMALAFPYAPAPGDVLLVIGRGPAHYVIGVLHGSGQSALHFPGDVELRADGALRLAGGTGVTIEAPETEIQTGKLRMMAGAVVQMFTSVHQRVTDLLSVHARASRTLVDEASYAQSKSAAIVTEETVTINGREIHLG